MSKQGKQINRQRMDTILGGSSRSVMTVMALLTCRDYDFGNRISITKVHNTYLYQALYY